MILAIQEGLFPTTNFAELIEKAKRWDFEAVEVMGQGLEARLGNVKQCAADAGIKVCSICPGGAGIRGSLISDDSVARASAHEDIMMYLEFGAELDGAGLVLVPEFSDTRFAKLYPDLSYFEKLKGRFLEEMAPLARRAASLGVPIFIEPLNRYETNFLLRLDQAAELCRALDSPAVKILADLFHMNIEESDLPGVLERNAALIGHVHLVDSNRLLPGNGHLDLKATLEVFRRWGYEGALCLECRILGNPDVMAPGCVERIRGMMFATR